MLKYRLIENSKYLLIYEYFPDGGNDGGFISMKKDSREVVSYQRAKNDEFGSYFNHMKNRMRQFCEENMYRDDGIIAWH